MKEMKKNKEKGREKRHRKYNDSFSNITVVHSLQTLWSIYVKIFVTTSLTPMSLNNIFIQTQTQTQTQDSTPLSWTIPTNNDENVTQ